VRARIIAEFAIFVAADCAPVTTTGPTQPAAKPTAGSRSRPAIAPPPGSIRPSGYRISTRRANPSARRQLIHHRDG
jgi:hypothetical protein